MTAEQLWKQSGLTGEYEAWAFSDAPDKLAALVCEGTKTATCSSYDMYAVKDDGVKGECVVTDEGNGVLEIKNIATLPESHGKGYGRLLIKYISEKYAGKYMILQVGTGDSPLTIPFYEKCGFRKHHKIKNFFLDNYDHPIIEEGVQLVDMVYLRKGI